jgi:hypothetical protein
MHGEGVFLECGKVSTCSCSAFQNHTIGECPIRNTDFHDSTPKAQKGFELSLWQSALACFLSAGSQRPGHRAVIPQQLETPSQLCTDKPMVLCSESLVNALDTQWVNLNGGEGV